jgi:hypothetical protein
METLSRWANLFIEPFRIHGIQYGPGESGDVLSIEAEVGDQLSFTKHQGSSAGTTGEVEVVRGQQHGAVELGTCIGELTPSVGIEAAVGLIQEQERRFEDQCSRNLSTNMSHKPTRA